MRMCLGLFSVEFVSFVPCDVAICSLIFDCFIKRMVVDENYTVL